MSASNQLTYILFILILGLAGYFAADYLRPTHELFMAPYLHAHYGWCGADPTLDLARKLAELEWQFIPVVGGLAGLLAGFTLCFIDLANTPRKQVY